MTKIIGLILCVLVLFTLDACGVKKDTAPPIYDSEDSSTWWVEDYPKDDKFQDHMSMDWDSEQEMKLKCNDSFRRF